VTAKFLSTVEARAAMGAVVDARYSTRFPSLLAVGNLSPPFLTLSQPHDEADPDFGSYQDKELLDHLEGVVATESVVVKRGQHIVPLNGKSFFVRADFNAPLDACSGSMVGLSSPSMQVKRAQRNRLPNSCGVNCASLLCSAAVGPLCRGVVPVGEHRDELLRRAPCVPAVVLRVRGREPCGAPQEQARQVGR
jgi:hypothetical protein